MNNHLRYRRQFLLARAEIPELRHWRHMPIGDAHLFAHPDLEITGKDNGRASLHLLGYIFDPAHPQRTNDEVVSDVLARTGSLDGLIAAVKPMAGRYALLYRDERTFAVVHDPLGLREVYYATRPNRVICGSQPNLVDRFSEPRLGATRDEGILRFYREDLKLGRSGRLWVGDETYFDGVKHLMPNHYLEVASLTAKRYWPNRRLERMDLDTAVKLSCRYLRGTLKAVTSRFDVMMAVTSGIDSRSLLAASREVRDRIYYFINQEPPLHGGSPDIRVPREMFGKLGVPFHVHEVDGRVDEEFREVFLDNVFMSTDLILPTIYNVYFKNHGNKVNLLGVGEIGRDYYGKAPSRLTGYYLARNLKYKRSRYATEQCEKWLEEASKAAEEYNVDIMKLFLWEGLLANWGVVGNSESDIAIEEFDPYDSHYIYEIMLSIDRKHTMGGLPDFFRAMYREMWPELLEFPFNPADTIRDRVRGWLIRAGLFQRMKRALYRLDHWRFRRLVEASQG
ncbi:MAG: hypothetical protein Kow0025_05030 [Thermodesulfovibrionales bacterium]